jgi:plastocyanin
MLSEGAAGGHAIAAHAGAVSEAAAMELAPAVASGVVGVPAQRALVPVEGPKEPPPGVHMPGPSPWPFFAPIALMVIFYGVIFSPILMIGGIILGIVSAAGWLRDANREWRSTEAVGHAVPATRDPRVAWPRRVVPVFIVVVAVCLAIVLIPALGNFLGSLKPAPPGATPVAVPAKPEISASTPASFETKNLVVPAGRAFELVFHNKNDGIQHNVEIANGPDRSTVFLDGEVITGVADATYQVPSLDVGTYYFLCKIHPNMNGTVEAVQETGQGGQPEGPPAPGGGSPGAPASP